MRAERGGQVRSICRVPAIIRACEPRYELPTVRQRATAMQTIVHSRGPLGPGEADPLSSFADNEVIVPTDERPVRTDSLPVAVFHPRSLTAYLPSIGCSFHYGSLSLTGSALSLEIMITIG